MGCTKFGERWDAGLNDLAIEAAYEAYEDAGVGPERDSGLLAGTVYRAVHWHLGHGPGRSIEAERYPHFS